MPLWPAPHESSDRRDPDIGARTLDRVASGDAASRPVLRCPGMRLDAISCEPSRVESSRAESSRVESN